MCAQNSNKVQYKSIVSIFFSLKIENHKINIHLAITKLFLVQMGPNESYLQERPDRDNSLKSALHNRRYNRK